MSTHKLSLEEAIQIWILRWLGEQKQAIILRFGQNPLRVYEVWTEETHKGSREIAMKRFKKLHPKLAKTTDFSPHQPKRKLVPRIGSASSDDDQPKLL